MDNSTITPLEGYILAVNQLDLLGSTTVAGAFYGLAFAIFCLYVPAVLRQIRMGERKRQAKFMLAYSVVIMVCGTYYVIASAWVAQETYIKHSDYPGSPFYFVATLSPTSPVVWIALGCQVVIDVLTLSIQIWRVWVIWGATQFLRWVVVIPILTLLTFVVLRMRTIILYTTQGPSVELDILDGKLEVTEASTQGATTVLCTLFICGYPIVMQWKQRKLIGKAQGSTGYMNVVAIIVESYALESLWVLSIAIFWQLSVYVLFADTTFVVEIISYFLVQYRVARGIAYESELRQSDRISSLHWNHSVHVTTQFGGTDEIRSVPRVPAVPEAMA